MPPETKPNALYTQSIPSCIFSVRYFGLELQNEVKEALSVSFIKCINCAVINPRKQKIKAKKKKKRKDNRPDQPQFLGAW